MSKSNEVWEACFGKWALLTRPALQMISMVPHSNCHQGRCYPHSELMLDYIDAEGYPDERGW